MTEEEEQEEEDENKRIRPRERAHGQKLINKYSQFDGNTDLKRHNRYDSKQSMVVMQTFEKEWQSAFL